MDRLVSTEDAVWHLTANGLGFERRANREAWLWQVNEGERLIDAAWTEDGTSVGFLSGSSFVLADIELSDESERHRVDMDGSPMAVARGESDWYTLVENQTGPGIDGLRRRTQPVRFD